MATTVHEPPKIEPRRFPAEGSGNGGWRNGGWGNGGGPWHNWHNFWHNW